MKQSIADLEKDLEKIDSEIDFAYTRRYNIENQIKELKKLDNKKYIDNWCLKSGSHYVMVAKRPDYHYDMIRLMSVNSIDENTFEAISAIYREDDNDLSLRVKCEYYTVSLLDDIWLRDFDCYLIQESDFDHIFMSLKNLDVTFSDVADMKMHLQKICEKEIVKI